MFGFVTQAGPLGIPLAIIALLVVAKFVKSAANLFGSSPAAGTDISGIKTLGSLALALGAFSTLLGLYQGLQIFSMLSTEQVASGLALALPSVLLGLVVYIISLVLWFVLSVRICKLNS